MRIRQIRFVVIQRYVGHTIIRDINKMEHLSRQALPLFPIFQHMPLVLRQRDGIIIPIARIVVKLPHEEVDIIAQGASGDQVGEDFELQALNVQLHDNGRFRKNVRVRLGGYYSILYLVRDPGGEAHNVHRPGRAITPIQRLGRHSAKSRLPLLLFERRVIKRQIPIFAARTGDDGNVPPPHRSVSLCQLGMPLFEFGIGFEGEDAVVAVVAREAELACEGRDGRFGVGVEVGFVEETGVDADVGSDV
mmetsp:Transcript_24381/g.52694  ORF Transcript_24381/g.52694 Transcript_24381/m.52694 type:complete len:248 (-) Transcript_24381:369-1112(-)